MAEKIYHYPLWIRIWHWINALACIVLIPTGLIMQYASQDFMLLSFETAVTVHNMAGMILVISYPVFFFGNLFGKNGAYYKMNLRKIWRQMMQQIRYYIYGVFKGEHPPFPINENRKFNPLQKFTYVVTMFILYPILMLTGLALLFPEVIVSQVGGYSGTFLTALLHTAMGFLVSLFIVIHIYFATMGVTPKSNFRSMVNGWTEPH